jgi:hypothetical protein
VPRGDHPDAVWLHEKMLALAARADASGRWGVATHSASDPGLAETDDLVYDRFGPAFSDRTFAWHTDAREGDGRDISVVAYFTDPTEYAGGTLELRTGAEGSTAEGSTAEGSTAEGSTAEGSTAEGSTAEGSTAPGGVERLRCPRGSAVAFRSAVLEHRVTEVTRGERRSLLLLCGASGARF